jgi:type I restriction-modification system DNA methylase subunit/restriction endonuclease S subunit
VHNKTLFEKNAKVLIEIVQMWQDSRLTTHEQNQFLGDMFEYFLDNGIKQSEGQFFTPMPICRFILMSLPLEHLIQHSEYAPKVIDYACGAGHFLNEYAAQIKPLLTDDKHFALNDCYAEIVGIEKEDRLAKVAKVSAFMYGQDAIKIIDADALATHEKLKADSFNVLVANPPFAVEGFLETLEEDRENYTLLNTVSDVINNRNIQCFFIERAKQLLAPNGIAAIIVPSSVLSNSDATHIGSREILLQYFDIVAIVELGSGTFGKTGTNTVILFLRRKYKQPTEAEHYKNRVDDWFNGLTADAEQAVYQDDYIIKKYCEHIAIDFDSYQSLLTGEPNDELLATELFVDYHHDFYKSVEVKNLTTRHEKQLSLLAKNLAADIEKQQKDNEVKLTVKEIQEKVKTLLPKERIKLIAAQTAELNAKFLAYLQAIEKDKLFYFVLAYHNPQKVLVVKSPSDGKEQKAFLGYEWSAAKGNEGIKLTTDNQNNHLTPLYDVTNRDNPEKINALIARNFLGNELDLNLRGLEDLAGLVTTTRLIDMLDFSRKDFNKAISLTVKTNIVIESKWNVDKLENLMTIVRGASPRPIDKFLTNDENGINWIKIGDVKEGDKYITQTEEKITPEGAEKSRLVKEGDFILSNSMSAGRPYILKITGCIHDGWLLLSQFSEILNTEYFYYLLSYYDGVRQQLSDNALGGTVKNLNIERVKTIKIPLPPTDIQQQIVTECEAIDKVVQDAIQTIEKSKNTIEVKFIDADSKSIKTLKLTNADIFEISIGKRVVAKEIEQTATGIPVYSANVFEPFGYIDKDLLENFDKPSVIWGIDGDWMVNFIDKHNPFYPTDHCGVLRVNENEVNPRYLVWVLNKAGQEIRFSRHFRASIDRIKGLSIKLPAIDIQNTLVSEIEILETEIAKAQLIINEAASKKQAVLKRYL